ncbi:MAG: aspartate--tRNA ligase [Candidatus Proteinoplasmatales archaeon SG8-5]|nr:MAG: aspartate--tRNA ligase [Candidatus Proteinoplasmatales archaeon SG8-5]
MESHNLAERKQASALSSGMTGTKVTVAGWLQDTRNLGGIAFLLLRDRTGVVQVTALKKKLGDEVFTELTSIPRESVLAVTGEVKENEQVSTGFEILPESYAILSRAATPLPLGIIDKVGVELDTRLNNRFLDLRKEEVLGIFNIRNLLLKGMREYLGNEGFIEIHTPKIVAAGAEGGATLFPIEYFEKDAYLAQSPQLYKQLLMSAGFDKVYELAPAFRAERSDTVRHLAEFASLDVELSFIDGSEVIMNVLEGLITHSFKTVIDEGQAFLDKLEVELKEPSTPFPRITFEESVDILEQNGLRLHGDMDTEAEKKLGELMLKEHGAELYFITSFPTELKKETFYAMREPEEPSLTRYFDLDYRGEELVSGGQREHRYNFLVQQMNEIGLDEAQFGFYLNAFKYGMPPHGGFGLGVERVLHMMLSLPNIRECVLFPRDMNRIIP